MFFQPVILNLKNITEFSDVDILAKLDNLYQISEQIRPYNIVRVENEKNSIGIQEISSISSKLATKNDELKVVIIVNAEKLTEEAQNSLLKTLEETPNNSLIVLATLNPGALLETIISRCILVSDNNLETKSAENELFDKFLNCNYIERISIIEEILKEENSRTVAIDLVLYIMNYVKENSKFIHQYERLKEIYLALKQGVIVKLALENLNIELG
jgi:DNA polymerase-3 subunit delta'